MVIVVGGHSRNIGKTSVVCGIIRALPDWNWTALKITPHAHGSSDPVAVPDETGPAPSTDSGRFLAAGAVRAFLLRAAPGELNAAVEIVRRAIAECENVIIESNSILRFSSRMFARWCSMARWPISSRAVSSSSIGRISWWSRATRSLPGRRCRPTCCGVSLGFRRRLRAMRTRI